MAKDLAWLTAMAGRLPKELQTAQERTVMQMALVTTKAMREQVRLATGGDSRLSGVGKKGARIGARYVMLRAAANPTAAVRATGPAHLVEHPTEAHSIAPKRRRGEQGRRALRFRDGRFAASAQHRGTHPSKPYERGYLASRDAAGQVFDRQVQDAIRKAMR